MPTGQTRNREVIAAIRAHHDQLAEQLRALTADLVVAAQRGSFAAEQTALHDWYRTELLPHADAEERALYRPAVDMDATRLLVRSMIDEHRALAVLVAELAEAGEPWPAVIAATSAQALFALHLAKENDLLLPAMDGAAIDLEDALQGMHEILGAAP
jgi:hemerythrin HHE cation binding domain-containing protein